MFEEMVRLVDGWGAWFCGWAWAMLWQSSIVIGVLFVADIILRKYVRATVRYALWMLILIKLVLPPSLCVPTGVGYWCNINLPTETAVQEIRNPKLETRNNVQISNVWNTQNEESTRQPSESMTMAAARPLVGGKRGQTPEEKGSDPISLAVTWQGALFGLWAAGVLILVLLVVQRAAFVRSLIAQSRPAEGRLREMMDECRVKAGIRADIDLRLTENMLSPAACGLSQPVVLMPRQLLEGLSRERVRAVLMHELAHVRRGDLWVNLVQTALQIVHFYNPLLWFANARIRRVREEAVDEAALVSLGDEAREYGRTLAAVAEAAFARPHLSLRLIGVVESKKSLAARIRHIAHMGVPKSAKIGMAGIAAVIVAACVLLPMAKAAKEANPVPKGGLYENAKGSRNYRIKVGPTRFAAHTVVRYMRDGQTTISNLDDPQKLKSIDMFLPDFSAQSNWMDIAQVYLTPDQSKYDVIEMRIFDHRTRELLTTENYPGIGWHIEDSVVTVFSIGRLLPDSLDIWMRVLHNTGQLTYGLDAREQAAVDVRGNPLRVVTIADGRYDWANGKPIKHHAQWDGLVTSVAVKFDKGGNRDYQICAVGKDWRRVVPDSPHFLRPSNGWQLVEFAMPLEDIMSFEVTPFLGRDRFFFNDVRLPARSGGLYRAPAIRFETRGQTGRFGKQVGPFCSVELSVIPSTKISEVESGTSGPITYSTRQAEGLTAIVCTVNGMAVRDIVFEAYGKEDSRLDLSKSGGFASSVNHSLECAETKVPAGDIESVVVRLDGTGAHMGGKEWVHELVEDFFRRNYRDVTARKTLEWGEPATDPASGNVSIRYKYEATIWGKDKIVFNEVFTFDRDGKFVSAKKLRPEKVATKAGMQELVEEFFRNNYRDITARKSLEWGEPVTDAATGNVSIRYKYEATIWDKDKMVKEEIFTFDKDGNFISVKKPRPEKVSATDASLEKVAEGNEMRRLLMERRDVLQAMLEKTEQRYGSGTASAAEVQQARIELLRVESELAGSAAQRVELLEQIVAVHREMEEIARSQVAAGRLSQEELNRAKLERLAAEEELVRAIQAAAQVKSAAFEAIPGPDIDMMSLEAPAGAENDGRPWVMADWPGASSGDHALRFDGSSDYVKIPSTPSLDIRDSLTLSAWVKSDGDDDGQIIWRGDNQGGRDPYQLHIAEGRMEFRGNPLEGNETCSVRSRETLDSNWHLWTATYDSAAKTMCLYRDGKLENTAEAPADFKYDTSKMWNVIGAVDFGNWQHFKGTIDEARVWNRCLRPDEIRQAFEGIYVANDPSLVAYWNFNEGQGNIVHDVSGNNNPGHLHSWTGRIGYIGPPGPLTSSETAEGGVEALTVEARICATGADDEAIIRFLTDKLRVDGVSATEPLTRPVTLTSVQADEFDKWVKSTPDARTLATPRVILRDGEPGIVRVTAKELFRYEITEPNSETMMKGVECAFTPRLQKDKEVILLDMAFRVMDYAGTKERPSEEMRFPVQTATSLSTKAYVSRGQSVLIAMGKVRVEGTTRQLILLVKANVIGQ